LRGGWGRASQGGVIEGGKKKQGLKKVVSAGRTVPGTIAYRGESSELTFNYDKGPATLV